LYILINIISTINDYKELVKMFSTLILPLPVAIYFAFILSSKDYINRSSSKKDILISILVFVLTTSISLILIFQYDQSSNIPFNELRILPLFVNSLLIFTYSINYLMIKNLKLSGILSGFLLGFAIYFFV
jgi:hypothetical protein